MKIQDHLTFEGDFRKNPAWLAYLCRAQRSPCRSVEKTILANDKSSNPLPPKSQTVRPYSHQKDVKS